MLFESTEPKLYSIAELSKRLGVKPSTMRQRIDAGYLPGPTEPSPHRQGLYFTAGQAEAFVEAYKSFMAKKK